MVLSVTLILLRNSIGGFSNVVRNCKKFTTLATNFALWLLHPEIATLRHTVMATNADILNQMGGLNCTLLRVFCTFGEVCIFLLAALVSGLILSLSCRKQI